MYILKLQAGSTKRDKQRCSVDKKGTVASSTQQHCMAEKIFCILSVVCSMSHVSNCRRQTQNPCVVFLHLFICIAMFIRIERERTLKISCKECKNFSDYFSAIILQLKCHSGKHFPKTIFGV